MPVASAGGAPVEEFRLPGQGGCQEGVLPVAHEVAGIEAHAKALVPEEGGIKVAEHGAADVFEQGGA